MSLSETDLSRPEFADELEKAAAVLVSTGRELPGLFRDCRRAWSETRPDGYPTSSRNEGTGPTNVTHEFVEKCPRCDGAGTVPRLGELTCSFCKGAGTTSELLSVPMHSDPVGEAAVQPVEANPAASAYRQARALLRTAEKAAAQAHGLLTKATTLPPELPADEQPIDASLWCAVCIKVAKKDDGGKPSKVLNPLYSISTVHPGEQPKDRCEDCEAWAREARDDPTMPRERPASLILMRERGERIFDRDILAAVEAARCPRRWVTDDSDHEHECQMATDRHTTTHACRWCEETKGQK